MSRPTDEKKDKTIKIRISEELYDKMKCRNMSEYVRELLEKSFVPTVKENENSFVGTKEEFNENEIKTLKDIESMVRCSGGTLEVFLENLDMNITMGNLPIVKGMIELNSFSAGQEVEKELNDLKSACEEKGVKIVDAIRKAKNSIYNIRQ